MNTNEMLAAVLQSAAARGGADTDYIDPVDGLRYCGICRTPKEAYFPDGMELGGLRTHPAQCRCVRERCEREERERLARRNEQERARLRRDAFRDIPAAQWRFERAAVQTPQLEKARRYVENWDELYQNGLGLLLFGEVGTGKSYAAGCIANALLERGVSVLFVSMTDVVGRMQSGFGAERESCLKSLMRPDLLILDDLGAERSTSYGKERVFDVVNNRTLTRKPMIITTNLSLNRMKAAAELDERRIYDRVLEVCMPIAFPGESFRRSNAAENLKKAARCLNGTP